MKLSAAPTDAAPLRQLKLWFRELHDDPDGSVSLQHELIDAILTLRYTRDKDGWCNWDESYYAYLDTLGRWLPATGRLSRNLAAVKAAGDGGADQGEFADDELERITADVFVWCSHRREPVLMPEGYHFWTDVPSDAIAQSCASSSSPLSRIMRQIGSLLHRQTTGPP